MDKERRMQPRGPKITVTAYLTVVAILLILSFDSPSAILEPWIWLLMLITLPGSAIALPFSWSLAHEAGMAFFALLFAGSAVFNSYLASRLWGYFLNRRGGNEPPKTEDQPSRVE